MFCTPINMSWCTIKVLLKIKKNVDTEQLINDARNKTCLRDSNTDDYKDKFKSFSESLVACFKLNLAE